MSDRSKADAIAPVSAASGGGLSALSPRELEVKATLDKIAPELFVYYQQGVEVAAMEQSVTIESRYKRGMLLRQTYARGDAACRALAAAWGLTAAQMRDFRFVAGAITEAELAFFRKLRDPRGLPLTWMHLAQCAVIKDKEQRRALMSRVAAKGWTATELEQRIAANEVEGRSDQGARPGAGRPFQIPQSLAGMLHGASKGAHSFERYIDTVVAPYLPDVIRETPPDAVDDSTLEKLDVLEATYGALARKAQELQAQLAALKATLIGRLGEVGDAMAAIEGTTADDAVGDDDAAVPMHVVPAGRPMVGPAPAVREMVAASA